jgi:hypothetical protein
MLFPASPVAVRSMGELSIPPRGARWRWVVSFTTLSGSGWPYGRSGSCGEGNDSLSLPEFELQFEFSYHSLVAKEDSYMLVNCSQFWEIICVENLVEVTICYVLGTIIFRLHDSCFRPPLWSSGCFRPPLVK